MNIKTFLRITGESENFINNNIFANATVASFVSFKVNLTGLEVAIIHYKTYVTQWIRHISKFGRQ